MLYEHRHQPMHLSAASLCLHALFIGISLLVCCPWRIPVLLMLLWTVALEVTGFFAVMAYNITLPIAVMITVRLTVLQLLRIGTLSYNKPAGGSS